MVGASIILTFEIRKLRQREVKKLPKITMLADEEPEPWQPGSRVHTLHNAIGPLRRVKIRASQQMFDRHWTVSMKTP